MAFQGLPLGPALFDVGSEMNCTLSQFADDTELCGAEFLPLEARDAVTGLRAGPTQTSGSSTRPSVRSSTWVGTR